MSRVRILLAAGAAGITLAASAPAVAHGPSRSPRTSAVRVVTYNVAQGTDDEDVARDLRDLAQRHVPVIALQEMGGPERRELLHDTLVDCGHCKYTAYMPTTAGAGQNPILFRTKRFELLHSGTEQVTDEAYVGHRGAGPSTVAAKQATWVSLRDTHNGRRLYVVNNHLIASVQAKDGGANERMEKRLEVYRQHLRRLRHLVEDLQARHRSPLFVTGDFNVNYRRDREVRDRSFPFVRMHKVDARASYELLGETERGTHTLPSGVDTRLIDYVYSVDHPAVTAERQHVLTGFASDHRPLVVKLGLAPRH